MKLKDFLNKYIDIQPSLFINAGVGPRSHNEADIIRQLWKDTNIIGFEPTPSTYKDRKKDYPGQIYPLGLWSISDKRKFYIAGEPGRSSFLQHHKNWKCPTPAQIIKTIEVECVTIDHFINSKNIFLWMDVEGGALEILKGSIKHLKQNKIHWIMVEITKKTRRKDEPYRKDIEEFLSQYGNFKPIIYQDGKNLQDILYILQQ